MAYIDIDELPAAAMAESGLRIVTDPARPGFVFIVMFLPGEDPVMCALDRRDALRASLDLQEAAGAGMVPASSALLH